MYQFGQGIIWNLVGQATETLIPPCDAVRGDDKTLWRAQATPILASGGVRLENSAVTLGRPAGPTVARESTSDASRVENGDDWLRVRWEQRVAEVGRRSERKCRPW